MGCTPKVTFATAGSRTLKLLAGDTHGKFAFVTRLVNVKPAPVNYPPTVRITSPEPGASFINAASGILVAATATDPEGETVATTWHADWTSGHPGKK